MPSFKTEIENSKQKALEVLKTQKEQLYQEGKYLKEKALKLKEKREKKVKDKMKKTREANNIGKLWLQYQQEQKSQFIAKRLVLKHKDETNKLKKAEKMYQSFKKKEDLIVENFKKDQMYQETILEEFKNTINHGVAI